MFHFQELKEVEIDEKCHEHTATPIAVVRRCYPLGN